MGLVIIFPLERRIAQPGTASPRADAGDIVILPVVRIDRHEGPKEEAPNGGAGGSRRGRRRSNRS
jgi:hypothetical protein